MSTAALTAASALRFADHLDALASQHAALESQHAELQAKYQRLQQDLLRCTPGRCCAGSGAKLPREEPHDINAHLAGVEETAVMTKDECHAIPSTVNDPTTAFPPIEPACDPSTPAQNLDWQGAAAGRCLLREGATAEQEPDAQHCKAADHGAEGERPGGHGGAGEWPGKGFLGTREGLPGEAAALPLPDAGRTDILEVLPAWADDGAPEPEALRRSCTRLEVCTIISSNSFFQNRLFWEEPVKWFMIHPDCPKRIGWDLLAMFMLGYDVTMTPLMVFELPPNTITDVMDLTTTIFWTFDIGLSFLTGYWKVHAPEMRPLCVAHNYMRRSFVPDILVAIFDWIMYGVRVDVSRTSDFLRLSKIMRVMRIFRILRLTRLVRLPYLFNKILKGLQSDIPRSFAAIARNLVVVLTVNHYVACLWYTIRLADDPSWTDTLDNEGRDITYRYWTAMHWSITQFTPASMEVQPRNTLERIFAICMVFFGLVVFSSFVGMITTTMASIRMSLHLEHSTKAKVMLYMSERMVSTQLGVKIAAFMASYKFTARPVHRKDIAMFNVLPKNLQLMLDWEVNGPLLARHSLFHHFSVVDDASMLELCGFAEELSLLMCEELFHPGKQATVMYFTVSGWMRCFHGFDELSPLELDCAGQRWLCEPAVWLRWKHRGRGMAVTTCSFVTLSSDAIHSVVCKKPRVRRACQIYAGLLRDELRARACLEQQECDMFGDFGDDLDNCLEKAQATFAKVEEIFGPWDEGQAIGSKLSRSRGHLVCRGVAGV